VIADRKGMSESGTAAKDLLLLDLGVVGMHATRVLHCFDQVLHFGLLRVVLHDRFVRLSRYFHLRFLHAFYALQCRLHCGQTVASGHPTDLQCHGLLFRWCRCSQGNQECKHRPRWEVDFSLHENHSVVMQSLELLLTSTQGGIQLPL
jgi:hypothetical protein